MSDVTRRAFVATIGAASEPFAVTAAESPARKTVSQNAAKPTYLFFNDSEAALSRPRANG
jgi:hypothetical protein